MTAAAQFDDRTAAAIRQAITEAGAGRLSIACEIGERALRDGGDAVALNAMIGMLRCRSGDFKSALGNLRSAHQARPTDVSIAINLASALIECGHHDEALAVASPERIQNDPSLQLARCRGYAAQLLGDAATAASAYEKIVGEASKDWQSWNNLGTARLLSADYDRAIEAFRKSLELNSDAASTWLNLGRALVKTGQLDQAEKQFRLAADRFPSDVQPLKELHDLLRRRGRPDEELHEVLEQAIGRSPEDRELALALAQQRMVAGQSAGAEVILRSLLARHPSDDEAYLELAKLYEHHAPGQLDSLASEAERASASPPTLSVLRAFAHRRAKRYEDGLHALEEIPAEFVPWLIGDLRGQFLDKLGRSDEAFSAFTSMNEAQAASTSQSLVLAERVRSTLRSQLTSMTDEWVADWTPAEPIADRPAPVFLVGFPRSGTTLLDTMLMGHNDVSVLEERQILEPVAKAVGGFGAVADLDSDRIRRARVQYWDAASAYLQFESKVVVDKNPLHLLQVPLIHRLFPDATFILALRHPADVLLSCYFSNFRVTPALANFLRLDSAADFYDLAFQTWERSCALLPLRVHTVVYERLVEDPEGQLRPVAEALGLEWNSEMLDHEATARSRGSISSASYAQVTEPLYKSSIGRWERYRSNLEPVLPILRPWAEKFGYVI
jgi:tetratricopeptide (TPR) repeat protein